MTPAGKNRTAGERNTNPRRADALRGFLVFDAAVCYVAANTAPDRGGRVRADTPSSRVSSA